MEQNYACTMDHQTDAVSILFCGHSFQFPTFSVKIPKMPRSKAGRTRPKVDASRMKAAVEAVTSSSPTKKLSYRSAAKVYDIKLTTLQREVTKFKSQPENSSYEYKINLASRKVFTPEEEEKLAAYIKKRANMCYGLKDKACRELAYKYAKANGEKIPESWEKNGEAGREWMKLFCARNRLSPRKPEPTSLSRATSFNPHNIRTFFKNLEEVLTKYGPIPPERIYNVDETGLTTVQQPGNVYAETGQKQVGGIVSAERGTLVTMINAINAVGNSVPPYFVFPRVHFRDFMLGGAPPGSDGTANPSGWSTEAIFLKYMDHFVKHTNPSRENRVLLILDNHESHMSPEVIDKADDAGKLIFNELKAVHGKERNCQKKSWKCVEIVFCVSKHIFRAFPEFFFLALTFFSMNSLQLSKNIGLLESLMFCDSTFTGVVMLTLAPHTSHETQPLDKTVYGPLKGKHGFYNAEVDTWMVNNPGKTFTIYNIAGVIGLAYPRAFTPSNITSGFRSTGIYPFNPDIFNDQAFMSSYVTDRPLESAATSELLISNSTSTENNEASRISMPSTSATPHNINKSNDEPEEHSATISPSTICPYPKAEPRKSTKRGRKPGRTRILTSTPEKLQIRLEKQKSFDKKKSKFSDKTLADSENEDDPAPIRQPVKRNLFVRKKPISNQDCRRKPKKRKDSGSSLSSESRSDLPLQYAESGDSSEDFSSLEEDPPIKTSKGDHILAKVHAGKGRSIRYYIGKVIFEFQKKKKKST